MENRNTKIQKDIPEEKIQALNRAKSLCCNQEKCVYDIIKKLQGWNTYEEFYESIIKELIDEGFIDETRYAKAFVNDKFRFAKWGKIKIIYALKGKKISDSVIQNAVDLINDTDYSLLIEKEIRNKFKALKDSDKNKLKAKLFRFSQSRGFDSDISFQVIDKLISNE